MSVSRTVSDVFSVKEWHDLKNWFNVCSRSLKMVPFNRLRTTFYWSAIVTTALYTVISFSSDLTLNNTLTLKSRLRITQDH